MSLVPSVSPSGFPTPDSTVAAASSGAFVDRRGSGDSVGGSNAERRQFGSSHSGLSAEGRELAAAIDQYKLQNHRRYITCDEMLSVLHELGYERVEELRCRTS